MTFITGDTHGDWDGRVHGLLEELSQYEQPVYLLIAGDFGFLFHEDEQEQAHLDEMERSGVTVCFCDGNHENFDALNALTVGKWNGGRVHFLRPHVIHLMRGERFLIDSQRFFVMGGAASVDKTHRLMVERFGGEKCWWPQELPTDAEYKHAAATMEQMGFQTDYILTHTAPRELIRRMGYAPSAEDTELTGFLEWVLYDMKYRHWYFGHFHEDRELDCNCTCLMHEVVRLN